MAKQCRVHALITMAAMAVRSVRRLLTARRSAVHAADALVARTHAPTRTHARTHARTHVPRSLVPAPHVSQKHEFNKIHQGLLNTTSTRGYLCKKHMAIETCACCGTSVASWDRPQNEDSVAAGLSFSPQWRALDPAHPAYDEALRWQDPFDLGKGKWQTDRLLTPRICDQCTNALQAVAQEQRRAERALEDRASTDERHVPACMPRVHVLLGGREYRRE